MISNGVSRNTKEDIKADSSGASKAPLRRKETKTRSAVIRREASVGILRDV